MSKEITANNSIVILTVATSFGEIDWILPVLKVFLEANDNFRLVTVFGHKVVFDRLKLMNQRLYNEFAPLSSHNIVPQEIDLLFSNRIDPDQVKIIFKDYNNDEFAPFKTYLADKCPKAMLVSHPHSSHIYSNKKTDTMTICNNPDEFSKHDIFMLGSENDIPYWSEFIDVQKIRAMGNPRFDSWWINRFLEAPEFKSSTEFHRAQEADKVFFWVGRGVHPHYLSQTDYEYLVKSMADVVFSYDNSLLLVKPHPRQDVDEIFRLLAPYDKNRYLVSGSHLLQLSHISDLVISPWTSPLDALSIGKPVIEFWRFGGRDPICRKTPDGKDTTIYRELDLVAPADTKEELETLIKDYFNTPDAPIWESQIDVFNKICKPSDRVSYDIARTITDELKKHETLKINPDNKKGQKTSDEVCETMIEFVISLVETGQDKRAKHWFDFMNEQFPKDVHVLNSSGVFLFNQGDVNAAVDRLVECLNIDPLYYEAAVNLVQILLIVERTNDAFDIVVAFYAQTTDEEKRNIFLQALARQLTEQQFSIVSQKVEKMRL
ncbi:MAG: hypothetical protein L3J69_03090 [Desulfobacula sp.]|nr:hypothetical protein [Desulfobacula sp.]